MPTTTPTPIPEIVIDNRPWTEAEIEEHDRRVRENRERRARANGEIEGAGGPLIRTRPRPVNASDQQVSDLLIADRR